MTISFYKKYFIFACTVFFYANHLFATVGQQILTQIKDKQNAHASKQLPEIPYKKIGNALYTQTEAYLKINYGLVQKKWGYEWNKYQSIIDSILSTEKKMKDTHYTFYHAQRSQFRIVHDVLKEIYQLFTFNPPLKEFNFLRAWYDVTDTINVHTFLNSNGAYLSSWWNHSDSAQMICVNLSLFGNSNNPLECTFHYFVNNSNIIPLSLDTLLAKLFSQFNFDKSFMYKLKNLADKAITQEGILYQIFIPKEKVDSYLYLAHIGSAAWNKPIISTQFDYYKKRHTYISPILELYCSNPAAIPEIDAIQARILLSKDLLLNPESGVKILRFTTLTSSAQQEYQAALQELVHVMIQQWLDNKNIRNQLIYNAALKNMPIITLMKDIKI